MNIADYLTTPGAPDMAQATTQHLVDGATIDQERGDITADGYHAFRLGSIVSVSTSDSAGAIDHNTAAAAKKAFAALPETWTAPVSAPPEDPGAPDIDF